MRNSFYILIVLLVTGCSTINIDFYLPEDFKGEVAIIYDCNFGDSAIYEKGRLKFIIPESGIIFTKAKYESGHVDLRYFRYKKDGNLERINVNNWHNKSNKDLIYFERTLTFTTNLTENDECVYFGNLFFVGKSMDSITNKKRWFFERHIQEILKNKKCR